MARDQQRFLWLGISILGLLAFSTTCMGQNSPDSEAGRPLTTDWSNHHLIFSRPATAEQAARLRRDPRYTQELLRRAGKAAEAEAGGAVAATPRLDSTAALFDANYAANYDTSKLLNGDWSQDMGSGATVGAINYPAKYSFRTDVASCANDFAIYGTGLAGSAGQASIVGYNNIYSGCGGTVPSVYWAYDTDGGTAVTSPLFSRDGTQIAFVQSGGGFKSTIVLLKWAASTLETITTPLQLTPVFRGLYPTCVAPCETQLQLRDASGTVDMDSNSSIFYDYSNDTAYVGDDDGWLHKYTPFFNGKPGEVRTGGWPVQVNPGAATALTSPVHDYASGNVFVADKGGFLYLVNSSTGAVTTSGQLDFSVEFDTNGPGIVQGPIVDSTSGLVYVFATSDGSQSCSASFADCTAVFKLTTNFAPGATGSEAVVGDSTIEPATPNPLYLGAFDSTYENSVNATGHLYVCGNTGGPPILYQVPIGAGVLGTPISAPVLSNDTTPCSPVTDVFNPNVSGGATEWIFASTQAAGVSAGCSAGGCIFNFKDTPWLPSTAYTVGQEVLDTSLHIEVVETAGTSGSTPPFWDGSTGGETTDGTVHWLDQGLLSAFTPAAWIPNHPYVDGTEILDGNGNIELVTRSSHGQSGAMSPTFNITPGGTTADNTITWTNVGAIATAAVAEAGGTSGMVIDNTVSSGTQPGASNIYFSTLSDQPCGTSGTGGCAIQASQATLQ